MSSPKKKARRSVSPSTRKSGRAVEGLAGDASAPKTSDHKTGGTGNGEASGAGPAASAASVPEKIKDLVRLAQEQGYLTYTDINDALPDGIVTADELDEIYVKLRNLEIEIVDQAE